MLHFSKISCLLNFKKLLHLSLLNPIFYPYDCLWFKGKEELYNLIKHFSCLFDLESEHEWFQNCLMEISSVNCLNSIVKSASPHWIRKTADLQNLMK